jgi:hypothetical protein
MEPTLHFSDWELNAEDKSYGSVSGIEAGYERLDKFSTVPPASNDAVFILPCLYNVRAGGAPEDWEIPLHFVPAPPDMTAFPVIEITSPTGPGSTVTPSGKATLDTGVITLTIDRAVPMEGGYLLYSTLHWENSDYFSVDFSNPEEAIHLLDASGGKVPFEMVHDEYTLMDQDQRRTVFAIKSGPVQVAGPLTLIVDTLKVGLAKMPEKASFTFDTRAEPSSTYGGCPDPQAGRSWDLNRDIRIGEYSLRVVTVGVCPDGFSVSMQSDPILDASLSDPEHPACAGSSGGENGQFNVSITFCNSAVMLSGPVTIEITGISVRLDGPWQASWNPPVGAGEATSTP